MHAPLNVKIYSNLETNLESSCKQTGINRKLKYKFTF